MKIVRITPLLPIVIFMLQPGREIKAQNWPQFLGPEAAMIVEEGNPPSTWSESENIAWTYKMKGESWASPVVWDGKVFISWSEELGDKSIVKSGGDVGGKAYSWKVASIDLESGKELWTREARRGYPLSKKHGMSNYACETPVTDGERLYVYFGMHGLYCYNLAGDPLWSRDLGAFKTQMGWGTGSSPILHEDKLFVQVDSDEKCFLVALDKTNGEELWRVKREENTNYSTPYVWKNHLRTELVVGGNSIRSYNPENGSQYWELDGAGKNSIPSATGNAEQLIVGNVGFMRTPASLFSVKAGASGDISPAEGDSTSAGVLWSQAESPLGNASPLLYEGLLYIVSERKGMVHVFDPESGQKVYAQKIEGLSAIWSSPWAHKGRIYFTDQKGVTTVIKAGREFELLHQNKLDDKIWSSIAATGNSYLVKGLSTMYCIRAGAQTHPHP